MTEAELFAGYGVAYEPPRERRARVTVEAAAEASEDPKIAPPDPFWSQIKYDGRHWLWTGPRSSEGYGVYGHGFVHILAHRHAYQMLRQPLPEGVVLTNLCGRQRCVHPDCWLEESRSAFLRRVRNTSPTRERTPREVDMSARRARSLSTSIPHVTVDISTSER